MFAGFGLLEFFLEFLFFSLANIECFLGHAPVFTGHAINVVPGVMRDPVGYVNGSALNVYFGTGTTNPFSWDLYHVAYGASPTTMALKQAWDATLQDHWITTGYIGSSYGSTYTVAYLHMAPQANQHALYNCTAAPGTAGQDYFLSKSSTCEGYYYVGKTGYIYTTAPTGISTVPIYRCYSTPQGNTYVATTSTCGGGTLLELLGYALTTA